MPTCSRCFQVPISCQWAWRLGFWIRIVGGELVGGREGGKLEGRMEGREEGRWEGRRQGRGKERRKKGSKTNKEHVFSLLMAYEAALLRLLLQLRLLMTNY